MARLAALLLLAVALPATATATAGTVTADRAGELQYIVKQDCGSCHGLR
ncbi:MAG TPA: cytochrome c, partial [Paracoccus sp. (in: a-proteobacteria)]|nr:cytochrome c [Paracoccus sp. (in: a-proteobacteria)]